MTTRRVVLMQPDPNVQNTSKTSVPNNLSPVYYALKTLMTTKSNYSNIEREMLGMVFSVLHFKHFTYGHQVTVITDHKPLITLYKKNIAASSLVDPGGATSMPPLTGSISFVFAYIFAEKCMRQRSAPPQRSSPRPSQILIKITDFQIGLQHQEGSQMHLSDAISRFNTHDSNDAKNKAVPIADFNISIHKVEDTTGFKSITMKQIASETATDVQLEKLKKYIIQGFPKSKYECAELTHDFYYYRELLSIINGLILKDKCIVIPTGLRDDAMSTLHRSHMGIVRKGLQLVCFGQECTVILRDFVYL